ncbi:class II fructose-bisphosphate aldolase [Streptomyces samsunensis]|uniref:Fructose-bisphosphate aldolase n=1 Tax=Streptomyces malaysiensis TaxID=92644 RepID=A0A2J7YSN7_STRMQ|nr:MULTISPECIES: class II fructose-bisphosphate aldolase [Streptomyces]MCD9594137.1 class II fructose-bisphosphate aldolase [Streptomyces sp. 8ZJF_21]MCM3806404.1 class II fructose-bisphosphate aldolase [Streptomyces sp. DR7-3]MCQ6249364.1 class II fructose-bisphosphate aldolase [Streptomyces malaysiensis]NUH41775.1 class II fructose-bisphosphate aldolase [Streptomyces samsunensis]PNG91046.1 fructose-bisphosphate aldolase [Streptomyces malaysiensis]
MPLVATGEIVGTAARAGLGAGAFNVIQIEHAQAIVAGAEAAGAPVILQISENAVRYHGALAAIGRATVEVARAARVPVAVHLDHATGPELVREAVDLGFGSVMFDASALDYDGNVAATAGVTADCHAHGVWVEAELGEVGGKDGVHAPGARTDPAEAAAYVAATGVDALAVAVGTSHAMVVKAAVVDLSLVAALRTAVPVPLVLHGSSGVPEADLTRAVEAGLTKVNIATHLNVAYTRAIRDHLTADPDVVDPRRYVAAARDAVAREVTRLLKLVRATH